MASLQDQLLKAGLSNQSNVKKLKADKRKQAKQQKHQKQPVVDEAKEQLKKTQALQQEKDRELNKKRQQEAEQKQIQAQVKQLIEQNQLKQDAEGEAFNFTDQNKVKTIYLADDHREQISKGILAIVKYQQTYAVVHYSVAEKISIRDSQSVILLNTKDEQTDENDPYAEYQVPDDLVW